MLTRLRTTALILLLATLSACAGSSTAPTVLADLAPDQRATLHLATITTSATPGLDITPEDLTRITQLVTTEIRTAAPTLLDPADPQAKLMKLTLTRYDRGNAAARFLLAGFGQIHIECDLALIDPKTQQPAAQYKLDKTFAFGGLYGGLTNIQDVEKGLARSVADIVKPKT